MTASRTIEIPAFIEVWKEDAYNRGSRPPKSMPASTADVGDIAFQPVMDVLGSPNLRRLVVDKRGFAAIVRKLTRAGVIGHV